METTAKVRETSMNEAGRKSPTDEDPQAQTRLLLLRYRQGDGDAFAALVSSYRRPVFSYLARCGVAEAERDDLFQTIFLKIHRSIDRYQQDRPPHPWIFTIVANAVRSHLRHRRVRELLFPRTPSLRDPSDPDPGGERAVLARQTVAWLESELLRLTLPQREVLVLACVEGLPLRQVADALGYPLNTVKTHLRRARLTLGRRLACHQQAPPREGRS